MHVCCCIGTSATARHDGSPLIMEKPGGAGLLHKDLSQSEYLKLSNLLDESLEMAPETRSSWLEELSLSDPQSAALLREMFTSHDTQFLEQSDLLRHPLEPLGAAHEGLTGKIFGPYRVLSMLGYGGMGSVWLAERVDGLFTRQVALKLVHAALKSRVVTERFTREREILASLNHPNIARLLDAGFAEDGQPYLALDYVAGTPLTTYCDDHRLSIRERLELFQQVLNAVQYAHAHLVIHRDLKPANILVTNEGQVQLLDFGIAKLLTEGEAKETELTQLGGRALTPDYAAPEQIAGAPITTAADVYALGVMLYELLTGERPYKLKRETRGALEEAILQAEPATPSRAALSQAAAAARATMAKKLSSTLRGDLDTIAIKALKKSPTERYATANAFGEDIARFLRGDVVLAQPDSVAYRVLKFARRHWVGIAATGILILTLAVGFAATSYEAKIASEQRDAARQAQSRVLTAAAAQHLKDSDLPRAQAIILEVLTNPEFAQGHTPDAISVFQDIRTADAQLAVLSGHADQVRSAAYSPDGSRIVTASWDKTARIWDSRTGTQLAVISGHADRVRWAAYSPDGSRIVTASWDKTARIWDAHTGRQLAVLIGHENFVVCAAYSPDGTRIITASYDKTARIWDARTGAQLAVLSGHGDKVRSAAFSPDGSRIVTASWDKTARIWDARTGAQLAVLTGHENFVVSAAYSPDGTRITTGSVDQTARIWDGRTGAQLAVLSGHTGDVNSAAYSPDGAHIVTTSADKTARIWDARTGAQLAVLSGHDKEVDSAFYSPDGTRIVTASNDKTARIWDARLGKQLAVLASHENIVGSAAYSPDGARIVTASFDKTARIWDARTGEPLVKLAGHDGFVVFAAYSPDGTRIVTLSNDKTARIWDSRSGNQLTVLAGHENYLNAGAYSPDGTRIVTASWDKTARIWNARTGVQIAVLSGHDDVVESAAYSPDGTRIVTASFDRTARIWDAQSAKLLAVLAGHESYVASAAYSPDGTRIVTASADKTARIWDGRTGAQLAVLSGHTAEVSSAAYSPDGAHIVTASVDKTARIWDARLGTQLAVLSGHGDRVYDANYSPDGTRVVTASVDKTARIWDGQVPATLDDQIAWEVAAQTDALSDVDRTQLGLPADSRARSPTIGSPCDEAAGAFYDPDRLASGAPQSDINADIADPACAAQAAQPGHSVRAAYQWGRALWAKHDVSGARRQFEFAVTKGYRAAGIDLGTLLQDATAGTVDPERAVSLYEKAWRDGVPIAAFALGHLYESGVTGAAAVFQSNEVKAWAWYQRGADAGEPSALSRFAEREERNARAEQDPSKADAHLLKAFRLYAAAARRAHDEVWPDAAWEHWRYRRATLARLLAREGMMSQVADEYTAVREKQPLHATTLWQEVKAKLFW
jgi:WD40 repeat protein/tRNA A-37 threonylcarbamoyl transferase component Bud32